MAESQQNPSPPPPPHEPPREEKKKGFGVVAWIAIGCIGIIVIGGFLTFACTAMLAKKAKNFVDEASDNPAMSAAEMVVKFNPNLEVVEKDADAGTITIYDKQKDETVKLNLDQIMKGKFDIETGDGETMKFDLGQNEDGGFGATVTDESGEVSEFSIGGAGVRVGGGASELPSWLPRYKDAEMSSPLSMNTAGKVSGTALFNTPDALEKVEAGLTRDLEASGFDVERTSYETAGVTSVMLACKGPEGQTLSVSINSRGNTTSVAMNFSGPSESAGASRH